LKAANSKFNGVIFTPSLFLNLTNIFASFTAGGIFNKIHGGGFVILGSKLACKFYDNVSKIFVSKRDCFKIYNEVVLHT